MENVNKIFDEVFNGQNNFITPDVISRIKKGEYLIELSTGEFMDKAVYGVTVLKRDGGKYTHRHELSKGGFDNRDYADRYINILKRYASGDYKMSVPDVTGQWDDFSWLKHIFWEELEAIDLV